MYSIIQNKSSGKRRKNFYHLFISKSENKISVTQKFSIPADPIHFIALNPVSY